MASKPKSKTFVVHRRGRANHGGCTILGSYRVGARNEKEAEDFVRSKIGKHAKVKTYSQLEENSVPYGDVVERYKLK
ncbi:hypothetical protein [Bacillus thuringiensis]|uniref:hypothetical protein n=1 Tax=Bacillus thuringiensis TaxID=1428 RepID=UPI000BFA4519|nr:hypothetical protein [Bacillus thuringiensis]PES54478.1 hypothetical protein CN506_20600 [Bacillus thuringiensis]